MKSVWLIVECDNCEGSGWQYCSKCEETCDHDRICARCEGSGQIPEKQTGFKAFAARSFENFESKKDALEWIRRE